LYNEASRRLILAFKHGHRIALAPLMARMMVAKLTEVQSGWFVVPVPLHRWRLWRRGFNQAAILARLIAQAKGAELVVDALWRMKKTPMLGGMGRKARARALAGAIGVSPSRKSDLRGARIILVDDVLTSGATSDACVRALERAGADRVIVACFARVLSDAVAVP
jgi:ComF family protein